MALTHARLVLDTSAWSWMRRGLPAVLDAMAAASSRSSCARYGELFARQRALGRPVPVTDLWLAACTLDCGGHLLTLDADFARIPRPAAHPAHQRIGCGSEEA